MIEKSKILLDMIYPPRCPVCGHIFSKRNSYICDGCKTKVSKILEPRCMKCGKALLAKEQEYCLDCSKKNHYFERGVSLWNYDDVMKRSISNFKYHHRKEYAKFYAEEFVKEYGDYIKSLSLDGLIPVPIHWTKYIDRGYNQAQVIAEEIGKRLNIPVFEGVLVRKKRTIAQKQLSESERARNLEHAFGVSEKWNESLCSLNSIMIIDDIYTTGCTINLCAKKLKEAGLKKVYFGVLCTGFSS